MALRTKAAIGRTCKQRTSKGVGKLHSHATHLCTACNVRSVRMQSDNIRGRPQRMNHNKNKS
eukprot:CAMPEP_0204611288 /NCGR_PEP_ID=MMETSP0661-20131031/61946_1 /ASSEMBLY_ACC=CAM_ASM_000606 /TAXON_ID=109239 /ORGANISM="Alexandrium margalefi, Strain AMGDE01CS-322" /LENGTH=61 /DNA_ID=CAMNT_0051623131 /DNA_START=405 /DNA_END=590 /DNA_ORIENTATION=-